MIERKESGESARAVLTIQSNIVGLPTEGNLAKQLDCSHAVAIATQARWLTAKCVVGGFKYGNESHLVGALLLGLFDYNGNFCPVGTTCDITAADRRRLTHRLEVRRNSRCFQHFDGFPLEEPRRTGWLGVKPELVVEVQYAHFIDGRFRKAIHIVGRCPESDSIHCTFQQIQAGLAG